MERAQNVAVVASLVPQGTEPQVEVQFEVRINTNTARLTRDVSQSYSTQLQD